MGRPGTGPGQSGEAGIVGTAAAILAVLAATQLAIPPTVTATSAGMSAPRDDIRVARSARAPLAR